MPETSGKVSFCKDTTMFQQTRDWVNLKIYHYQLMTGIYMLEPWERMLFNAIIFSFLAMSVYTTYAYLPRYTRNMMEYFGSKIN